MDQKITSEVKTKDPKRVEAGKKLAAISKAAKEKKMRERLNLESAASGTNYSYYTTYLIPTISVIVAILSLYYNWYYHHRENDKKKELECENKKIDLTPKKDTLEKL